MNRTRLLIAAMAVMAVHAGTPFKQARAVPLGSASRLQEFVRAPAAHGQRTVPPLAFVKFCREHPSSCNVHAGNLSTRNGAVIWTPEVLAGLKRANRLVNQTLAKRADAPGRDIWSLNTPAGDCEDFALAKRARLLAMGWPSSALAIAVVRTRAGLGHAVLIARTSAGDFVLDNLKDEIVKRGQTDYRFVSMQDGTRRLGWILL